MSMAITDSVKGIELTSEGKGPQKEIEFIHSEERVKVLHDPVRLQILQILKIGIDDTLTSETRDKTTGEKIIREREVKRGFLSVLEIIRISEQSAEFENLTKNQLYHHLPKLVESGFIVKHGIITKGKRTTDYYRRTAVSFVTFGAHYDQNGFRRAVRKETEQALEVFSLGLSKTEKTELLNLVMEIETIRLMGTPVVGELVKEDVADQKAIELFERLLWVYASGNDAFQNLMQKMREILFSSEE